MLKLLQMSENSGPVESLLNGDKSAWKDVFKEFFDPIYKYVFFRVNRKGQDTEDVVQEIFSAIAQSIRTYDSGKGDFGSWCFGIAKQKLALYYRKNSGRLQFSGSEAAGRMAAQLSTEDLPDEVIMKEEFISFVGSAFSTLPPRYQKVLILKYVDEMEFSRLAEKLNISVEAAKSLVIRAKEALRDAIKNNKFNF